MSRRGGRGWGIETYPQAELQKPGSEGKHVFDTQIYDYKEHEVQECKPTLFCAKTI